MRRNRGSSGIGIDVKYLVLDYFRPRTVLPVKKKQTIVGRKIGFKKDFIKKSKLYEKYILYQQFRQFMPQRREFQWRGMNIVILGLPAMPKELQKMPAKKVQKRIWDAAAGDCSHEESQIVLLAAEQELIEWIPQQLELCAEMDDVYIMLFREHFQEACRTCSVERRNARLLFLDDGSCPDTETYIRALSKDWNYVSVCSNRNEQFEELYYRIYEEEGLMIQTIDSAMQADYAADVVVDLLGSWKGIHRIYPKGCYVLDLTFSHQKEEYLRIKQVRLSGYVQVSNIK